MIYNILLFYYHVSRGFLTITISNETDKQQHHQTSLYLVTEFLKISRILVLKYLYSPQRHDNYMSL